MHPYLTARFTAGDLGQPPAQFVQRDVHRAVHVAGRPFQVAADVQHGHRALAPGRGQPGEVGHREAGQRLPRRPVFRLAGGDRGGPVDADPGQLPLGRGDLIGRLPEQRHRGLGREEPAQLGRERVAQLEAE